MQEGYDGLLRDKTRPSRIKPLGSTIAERGVMLTQTDPPAEATHWTSAMMAKVDISVGLYVDPPAQVVLSVNEKSQIQALDRTQPGLPLRFKLVLTITAWLAWAML